MDLTSVPLDFATWLMAGLLAGLIAALARDHFDRRVRSALDIVRRSDIQVLIELTRRVAPRFDQLLPAYGAAGRLFTRLRNEIDATLGPDDQILVITTASRGPSRAPVASLGSATVATNLAAALARTGSEVALVCANPPARLFGTPPVARMLGVCALPGLSDVLAGRVELREALQSTPCLPSLRIITTGGRTAEGLPNSRALADMLAALRAQADYVIIEAPSMATAPTDARTLLQLADAAMLVVELRRTRRAEIAEAAEQLRRIGTPLLGAVVLPRLREPDTELPNEPASSQRAGRRHRVDASGTRRLSRTFDEPSEAVDEPSGAVDEPSGAVDEPSGAVDEPSAAKAVRNGPGPGSEPRAGGEPRTRGELRTRGKPRSRAKAATPNKSSSKTAGAGKVGGVRRKPAPYSRAGAGRNSGAGAGAGADSAEQATLVLNTAQPDMINQARDATIHAARDTAAVPVREVTQDLDLTEILKAVEAHRAADDRETAESAR